MNIKKITISLLISTIILSGCGNEKLPATEQDAVMISEEFEEDWESVEEFTEESMEESMEEEAELEEETYVEESEEETVPTISSEEIIRQLPDGLELNLNNEIQRFSIIQEYNGQIYTCITDFDDYWNVIPKPQEILYYSSIAPTCLNYVADCFYIAEDGSLFCVLSEVGENDDRNLYRTDMDGSTWTLVIENVLGEVLVIDEYIYCKTWDNIYKVSLYDTNNIGIMGVQDGYSILFNHYFERDAIYKNYLFYREENEEQNEYEICYTDLRKKGSTLAYMDADSARNKLYIYDDVIYYTQENKVLAYFLLTSETQEISELLPIECYGCDFYAAGDQLIYLAHTDFQEDGLNVNIYCVDLKTLEKKLIGRTYQS